jgi:hypothetical protein
MFIKILNVFRIMLTHAYAWIALYLATVFVKNTVDFHGFEFEAAKAYYALFAQIAGAHGM